MIADSLVTLGMLCATTVAVNKFERLSTTDLKKKWGNFLEGAGIKNKMDKYQTFHLLKVIKKSYGFDAIISIPAGMSPEDLAKHKDTIEANIGCYLYLDWLRFNNCIYARFVTVPFDDKKVFCPVKTAPWEIYVGTTMYHQDIISDMRTYPHVLVSGTTGSGKSLFIFMIILNLLVNHDKNQLQVFLAQLSDKKDLRAFETCDQVKYYADTLRKASSMYKYLLDIMDKRNKKINSCSNFINNIYEYNKNNPKNPMPTMYVFTDEFSSYMIDPTDDDSSKALKTYCAYAITKLAKEARSVGIFLVIGLQRPDKENMPPFFKSVLCTRIAFAQNNTASALVVVDDGEAVKLNNREALCLMGSKRSFFKTPFLNDELLEMYVSQHCAIDERHLLNLDNNNAFLNKVIQDFKTKKSKKKGNNDDNSPLSQVTPTVTQEVASTVPNNVTNLDEVREANSTKENNPVNKGGVIK